MTKSVSELILGLIYFNLFFAMAALPGVAVLPNIFVLLFLLPVIPIYQYIREKTHYMIWIILTHAFIPIVLFNIADYWDIRLITVGFAVLYSFFSISRFKKIPGVISLSFSITSTCIFFVLVIIAVYNNFALLMILYPVLIVISIVLTIIHRIISKADESLSVIRATSAIPVKKITRFNYILAVGTGAAIVVLGLFLFFVLIRPTMSAIYNTLPRLRFEPAPRVYDTDGTAVGGDAFEPPVVLDQPIIERPDRHWLVEMLFQMLFILGTILVIVFFSFVLFVIIRAFLRFLASKGKKISDNTLTGIFEDEKEFIYDRKPIFKKRFHSLHPIRRAFYEKILKYKKEGLKLNPSDTPTELAGKITTEDINELVAEYKNIRYY